MMIRGFVLMAALFAALLWAPAAPAQSSPCPLPSQPMCVGADKLAERAAAECRRAAYAGAGDPESCPALPFGRRVSQAAIRDYEKSWLSRTVSFQHDLANDVPFLDAPWVGTHNSFNDPNEQPTASHTDSNQQLGLGDQLRLDVRSLELDVHWVPSPRAGGAYAPVVCHGQGQYAGCTSERLLAERLPEVTEWLEAHPKQVLLLYVQDELGGDARGGEATVKVLRDQLGKRVYAPKGVGCQKLPLGLTRETVLRAEAQVVIVSSCGGLAPVAFDWPADVRFESRPRRFGAAGCQNDGRDVPYATRLVRMYEDSTWLTTTASRGGAAEADDGLTPDTVSKMLLCGVDLLGFDQLLPDDGRLARLPWSWAADEPSAGDCALMGADGRWRSAGCKKKRPVACRSADGRWTVLAARGEFKRKPLGSGCGAAGLTFAVPRTASENAALQAAAGGQTVLLGLRRSGGGFAALDSR